MQFLSITAFLLLFYLQSCNAQEQKEYRLLGGPCEGCEGIFEYDEMPTDPLDTLPDFQKYEPKLKISGTIYKRDGKTPAPNVILYIYHTDPTGKYPTKGDEEGWGKRHGYIRGWIKTGPDGKYTFYTHKPGSYGSNPAHIHPTVLEPDGSYYYIDEYNFESDPLLSDTPAPLPYGGSGRVKLEKIKEDYFEVKRDIILGLNVPDYK